MKKVLFILSMVVLSLQAYSQQGNLSVGLKGGYTTRYNELYGLDVAYHLTDPFEIVYTGLLNPSASIEDNGEKQKRSVYSNSLDLRLYLLMQRDWATGPVLGAQYLSVSNKVNSYDRFNILGFNVGWHVRVNVADNLKLNGGWRYTNLKEDYKDEKYSFFYVGLAYTFELH
jgi:opacity protein-like surface antigen